MKLKYILLSLLAVCTAFISCNEEFEPTYLDGLTVSKSYVTIAKEGGVATIDVTTSDSWTIKDADKIPAWLSVSPTSGSTGATSVTFSVSEQNDCRTTDLVIESAGKTQLITVLQGVLTPQLATCKEVIEGPDKNYRVKGVCSQIANDKYGNWYLDDGTGKVYIYGTLDNDGKEQNFKSLNIEVGDSVMVEGPRKDYNGTIELVNVTVVEHKKSLIKLEKTDPEDGCFTMDGGELSAYYTVKGKNGIIINLTDEQRTWITLKSIERTTIPNPKDETIDMHVMKVTFIIEPNTGSSIRTTTINVESSTDESVNEKGGRSVAETVISQSGATGSLDFPMTPEEAIAAANAGATSAVYVKGIVSKVLSGGYGAQYGNASFWISADGTYNEDLAQDFEVYQANWLGAQKWVEGNAQIEEGAEVLVYGPLTVYKGTAETQGKGAAYVYSVNGVTTDANGIGTLGAPFNIAGGIAAANAGTKAKVYVSGIVSELYKGGFDATYGNGSFYMSEDGVRHKDNALDFEAYQVNWLGGEKWNADVNPQIAVGDKVTIYGPLTVYNGLAETQGKGAAYVYSHNGSTQAKRK